MADFSIENCLQKQGFYNIAGVDEAGRGPLAGPVVAAAVILDCCTDIFKDVNDSKKITKSKRKELFELIIKNAISHSIQFVNENIIDNINILQSTIQAMNSAIKGLNTKVDFIIVDGNYFHYSMGIKDIPFKTIIKGDVKSISIAAASILAKVARDEWMEEVAAKEFPQYNFMKNKGYPTKEHINLLKKYGACKYHRKSFIKKINVNNLLFKESLF